MSAETPETPTFVNPDGAPKKPSPYEGELVEMFGLEPIGSAEPIPFGFIEESSQSPEHEIESKVAYEFAGEMEKQGIYTTVLEGERNPLPDILKSLTLVNHETLPDEPTVRLYRGVYPTDGRQLAHQVGYLLKRPIYAESGQLPQAELESPEVFQLVEAFSKNPSYRALMDAASAAQMSDSDRRFVERRVKDVRRSLVRHPNRSLLDELTFQHINGPGGAVSQDLSPFVATSTRLEYAARCGRTVMVLDVPLSRVAGLGEGADSGDEVLLTGEVKPEWITAIAELKGLAASDELQPLEQVLGTPEPIDPAEFADTVMHQKSKENYQDDLREANIDLINELLATPGVDPMPLKELFENSDISTYRDALWAAADYYAKQLQAMSRYPRVSDVRELYRCDELNQYDYLKNTPDPEKVKTSIKANEGVILDLKELEKLATEYNYLSDRNK